MEINIGNVYLCLERFYDTNDIYGADPHTCMYLYVLIIFKWTRAIDWELGEKV